MSQEILSALRNKEIFLYCRQLPKLTPGISVTGLENNMSSQHKSRSCRTARSLCYSVVAAESSARQGTLSPGERRSHISWVEG